MESEPEYTYAEPAPSGPSLHMPFALLSSALAVIMIMQTVGIFHQKTALKEGMEQLTESVATPAEAVAKRKPIVDQTGDLKKKLNDMIMDILLLAKTDEDAKAIVTKYNIQQNLPPGSDSAAPKQP